MQIMLDVRALIVIVVRALNRGRGRSGRVNVLHVHVHVFLDPTNRFHLGRIVVVVTRVVVNRKE